MYNKYTYGANLSQRLNCRKASFLFIFIILKCINSTITPLLSFFDVFKKEALLKFLIFTFVRSFFKL